MMNAYVSEIYASVQGEGLYTGERQIFFRLAGCPLRCDYCDTPASLTTQGHTSISAPAAAQSIIDLSKKESVQTVSITGGEPLAHIVFLKELIPLLKEARLKIYIETAGIHHKALSEIVQWCDVISMDIKLPSAVGKAYWDEHKQFLDVGGEKILTKVVLEHHSTAGELDEMIDIVARAKKTPPLVLQPVSSINAAIKPPSADTVAQVYQRAKSKIPHVYVMTQKHKEWNIR